MNRAHKVDAGVFDAARARTQPERVPVDARARRQRRAAARRLRARAAARLGRAEAERRLVFADLAHDDHLWRLRAADVALDTRSYNSHTLAADYLWAGVPLVTALCDGDGSCGGGELL